MKIVTFDSLKIFLDYLRRSFRAPFATRDGDGNIITDTYLRLHGRADSAEKAVEAAKCTGNAASADEAKKLKTARSIKLLGDVNGEASFDGSEDITIQTKADISKDVVNELRADTETKIKSVNDDISKLDSKVNGEISKTISDIREEEDAYHDSMFRKTNTAYKIGDAVFVKGAGVGFHLRCVTAGTTGDKETFAFTEVGIETNTLDGYEYDGVHIDEKSGYITVGSQPVAAALLATGGGNGTWAQTDAEGNEF